MPRPLADTFAVPSRLEGGGGGRSCLEPFRMTFVGDDETVEGELFLDK